MNTTNPKPTILSSVSGTYRRRQGHGAEYAYDGTYGVNSEGTWWMATIRCEGRVKGTPLGTLEHVSAPSKTQISRLIEGQIERLDQVAE